MTDSKNITRFDASWKQINNVVHDSKGALTLLNHSMSETKRAMERIVKGLETIDEAINNMREIEKSGENNDRKDTG